MDVSQVPNEYMRLRPLGPRCYNCRVPNRPRPRQSAEIRGAKACRPLDGVWGSDMDIIWTPWRMEFIMAAKPTECIFCEKPREDRDRENYILFRGTRGLIMLNAYPYNNGHLLIIPYAHENTLEALDAETAAELMNLTQRGIAALRRCMKPDGLNVGMNIGKAAGAGIADHVHIHVVPRWAGDTNFMPIVGSVRIVPELLETTYAKLIEAGIAE